MAHAAIMGAMKTHRLAVCGLAFALQAGQAMAEPADLRGFATCAGRFSALMEHQWITDPPASDRTASLRAAMLSLVEAVTGPEEAAQALNWRVEAKAAQAALLSRATFQGDPSAASLADRLTRDCAALIGQS